MNSGGLFDVFVVHYSKLTERRSFLSNSLNNLGIEPMWVTEQNYLDYKEEILVAGKILGVNEKLVGMDLGINSRSLTRSRRRSRIEGAFLFVRSYFSGENNYSTGSLPVKKKLGNAWLELQRMHLTALSQGVERESEWILILEDDAVPTKEAFSKINKITQGLKPNNTWLNLNSGAGLKKTKSEKVLEPFGLFRIKPAATRCAVAYLVSNDLARKIVNSAMTIGIPDWLPIDFYYQVLLRKFRAKTFWIEPVLFDQGSESGEFESGFNKYR